MKIYDKKPSISDLEYSENGSLKVLIDYLTFTVPFSVTLDHLFYEVLGIPKSEFSHVPGSNLNGYSEVWQSKYIFVCSNARYGNGDIRIDMGHCVVMSGKGCREWEQYNNNRWHSMIDYIYKLHGKATRIDFAIDDFKGYFTIDKIEKKLLNNEVSSKFKHASSFKKYKIEGGDNIGTGFYFGSETSDARINIYEKNFEQGLGDLIFWNRTEIRFKGNKAALTAFEFIKQKNVGSFVGGLLNIYIRFLDRSPTDNKKSRWPTSKFWLDFIGHSDTVDLSIKKPDRDLNSIKDWLYKSVSRNFALYNLLEPDDIEDLIKEGMERLDKHDNLIIRRFVETKEQNEEILKKQKELIYERIKRKENLNDVRRGIDTMAWVKYKKNVPIFSGEENISTNEKENELIPYDKKI